MKRESTAKATTVSRGQAGYGALAAILTLRASGVTTLLIEQNARAALQVSDYAYVLETGEVGLEGPADELAGDPRVIETYLGLARQVA